MTKTESAPLLIEPQASRVYEGLPKNSPNSERLPQNSKVSERLQKSSDIPPSMSPLHNKSRFEDPQSSNNFPQSSNPNYMVPYQDSAFQSSDLRSDIMMIPFHDPNYTGPPSSKSAFQDRKDYSSEQQSSNVYNSVSQSSTSNVITSHDNQQDFQFRSDSAMFDSQRSNVYSSDPQSAKSTFQDKRDYSSELQSSKVHDSIPQSSKSTFQDRRDCHYSSEAQSSNVFSNAPQNSTSHVITSHDNHQDFESRSDRSQRSISNAFHDRITDPQSSKSSDRSQRSNDKTADSSCPDLERLDRSYTSVYEEKNMSTSYASVYDKIAR
jgi:hypothetical protein